MAKHRSMPVADPAVQTTLQEERWASPSERLDLGVERIRSLSREMYLALAKLGITIYTTDDPGKLGPLASLWLELNSHAYETENAKAAIRDQMVLIGQANGLFEDKKANDFLFGHFSVPVDGGEARVEHFDKLHVPLERRNDFYSYARNRELDLEEYTVPSLYLPFLAAKRGSGNAAGIVNGFIGAGIAVLARENRIKFYEEKKKKLEAAARQ